MTGAHGTEEVWGSKGKDLLAAVMIAVLLDRACRTQLLAGWECLLRTTG